MYSIKNLLQSAQLRQALTRKASNIANAAPTPWIAGAAFMGTVPSQTATQMQYIAANGMGNTIHNGVNMAQQAATPAPWAAPVQSSIGAQGGLPGQSPMPPQPMPAASQAMPQQVVMPQAAPPQASLPAMQMPPQIPPQLPMPVVKSGSIYRDLMKKHDRFTQRHLEPSVTYDKVKGGSV